MINQKVENVIRKLITATDTVYLVGGAVRDLLMGIEPSDYDIVTNLKPNEIIQLFSDAQYNVDLVGQSFGVVIVDDIQIATYRKDCYSADRIRECGADSVIFANSIEEDLSRRDFTINAICLDLKKIIKYYENNLE